MSAIGIRVDGSDCLLPAGDRRPGLVRHQRRM